MKVRSQWGRDLKTRRNSGICNSGTKNFTVVLTAPRIPTMGSTALQIETPTKFPGNMGSAGKKTGVVRKLLGMETYM